MNNSESGSILLNADQTVQTIRGAGLSDQVPAGGWLKAVRLARGVSQNELAAKLGFKRQAWAQFEASEARGAISLASLRRAADALGCHFSYQLVPREGSSGEVKFGRSGQRGSFRGAAAESDGSDFAATTPSGNPTPDVDITASFGAELPMELR